MSSLYLELQPDRVHSARQIPFSVLLLYPFGGSTPGDIHAIFCVHNDTGYE